MNPPSLGYGQPWFCAERGENKRILPRRFGTARAARGRIVELGGDGEEAVFGTEEGLVGANAVAEGDGADDPLLGDVD